eukprot:scaffold5517_cov135-Cylindrotheca_fusiformis.AAC.9
MARTLSICFRCKILFYKPLLMEALQVLILRTSVEGTITSINLSVSYQLLVFWGLLKIVGQT